MPSWPDDIHKRIRAARAYGGFSLEAMADAVEIGRNTLGRTEAGKRLPKRGEIREIAALCELPFEFFTVDLDRLGDIATAGLPPLPGELGQKHLEPEHERERRRPRPIRSAADERPGTG